MQLKHATYHTPHHQTRGPLSAGCFILPSTRFAQGGPRNKTSKFPQPPAPKRKLPAEPHRRIRSFARRANYNTNASTTATAAPLPPPSCHRQTQHSPLLQAARSQRRRGHQPMKLSSFPQRKKRTTHCATLSLSRASAAASVLGSASASAGAGASSAETVTIIAKRNRNRNRGQSKSWTTQGETARAKPPTERIESPTRFAKTQHEGTLKNKTAVKTERFKAARHGPSQVKTTRPKQLKSNGRAQNWKTTMRER